MHRKKSAPISRVNECQHDEDRDRSATEGPKERRVWKDALQAARPTDRFDVLENDADDFAEAECHDGQIVSLQTKRWHTDGKSGDRSHATARDEREKEENRDPKRIFGCAESAQES